MLSALDSERESVKAGVYQTTYPYQTCLSVEFVASLSAATGKCFTSSIAFKKVSLFISSGRKLQYIYPHHLPYKTRDTPTSSLFHT